MSRMSSTVIGTILFVISLLVGAGLTCVWIAFVPRNPLDNVMPMVFGGIGAFIWMRWYLK